MESGFREWREGEILRGAFVGSGKEAAEGGGGQHWETEAGRQGQERGAQPGGGWLGLEVTPPRCSQGRWDHALSSPVGSGFPGETEMRSLQKGQAWRKRLEAGMGCGVGIATSESEGV